MHLGVFVANVGFIFAAVVVMAVCGWVVIAPFRERLRYPLLVAPMAGLLCVLLVTMGLYVQAKLSLPVAGAWAIAAMLAASAVSCFMYPPDIRINRILIGLVVVIILSGFSVSCVMKSTVRAGGPALVYLDGTDHLGYTHLGDWLNNHRITNPPVLNQAQPYASWPVQMFQNDPRFGSFAYMALVSAAAKEPGMFTYDIATALIHVIAVLAVAGVFARSPLTLGFLMVGLFTSHWFDYGRTGYLGKNFGYPATFTVVALTLVALAESEIRISRVIALALLSAAAAFTYSGMVTAFFLGVIGGCFFLMQAIAGWGSDRRLWLQEWMQKAAVLGMIGAAAILASGTIARPLALGPPDWGVSWSYIFPRIAELESQGIRLSGFGSEMLLIATGFTFVVWIFLAIMAVVWRVSAAVAVLIGPFCLLIILRMLDATAVAFQLIGTFYPLALVGVALLFDVKREEKAPAPAGRAAGTPRMAWVVLGLAVVVVGLHQFRFFGGLARYGGRETPPSALYTKAEIESLAALVGRDRVEVDLSIPQAAIVLLVELDRRGVKLQWSPTAWKTVVGYRGEWSPPSYPDPGKWRIIPPDTPGIQIDQVVFRSAQYWVLKL